MSAGLRVRARAGWPERADDTTTPVAGFIESSFSPLVAEVAERCLRLAFGQPPVDPRRGERIAIVLLSRLGDVASAVRVARTVDSGGRVSPLQFFQSVPNSVAGHIAARWGLAGPLVCLGSDVDGLSVAALLIEDGDADEALVIRAEQATVDGRPDSAEALLVTA
jgi:hypothetical protein